MLGAVERVTIFLLTLSIILSEKSRLLRGPSNFNATCRELRGFSSKDRSLLLGGIALTDAL